MTVADEMAVYQAMSRAEREKEPLKSQRLNLARELWKFAAALDTGRARRHLTR